MNVLRYSIVFLVAVVWLSFAFQRNEGGHGKPTTLAMAAPSSSAVSEKPLCGVADDKKVQLPPNWDTFVPPRKGGSYLDPVFGCSIKRLTDSSREENS